MWPFKSIWKKLMVISLVILLLSIGIGHLYYNSLYNDRIFIDIEVVGTIELDGPNTIRVYSMDYWFATDWVAHIDDMESFTYTNDKHETVEYNTSSLTITPLFKNNMSGSILSSDWTYPKYDCEISFNKVVTDGKGDHMDFLWMKGASGEISGWVPPNISMDIYNVAISFGNQTITNEYQHRNKLVFTGTKDVHIIVNLANHSEIFMPIRSLDEECLFGRLKIIDFSGTIVEDGNRFYGNPTIEGKGIFITTKLDPEPPWPSRFGRTPVGNYWTIEIEVIEGHIEGSSYPLWMDGAKIGVAAIVALNLTVLILGALIRRMEKRPRSRA